MITKLRRRFIFVSTVSVILVFLFIFLLVISFNISFTNKKLDMLAEQLSFGNGRFPDSFGKEPMPDRERPKQKPGYSFITPETKFSTRHFTVWFDENNNAIKINTEAIYSIDEDNAVEYAKRAINDKNGKGWISNYRYNVFSRENEKYVVFIDGSMNLSATLQSMTVVGIVLSVCAALVLLLIILLSKHAVKPIAESYEKQKQFITNANHELKTPITLILTNLDIAESELGKNEWLDDIRSEGHRLSKLVKELVLLSQMDETSQNMSVSEVLLSELILDVTSEFKALAKDKGKRMSISVEQNIIVSGDENLLCRTVGILMDNAIKYCDKGGEICVSLKKKKRNIILTVENSYSDVESIKLNRLFDRFYRESKARAFDGGYGIGLSIAKAIVEKHRGEITAYKKGNNQIGFKVVLKK